MAQKREKDETLDLQVPSESPLTLSCPDNCKISGNQPGFPVPDPARLDLPRSDLAEPCDVRSEREDPVPESSGSVPVDHGRKTGVVEQSVKKSVNRCSGCAKRVGLTGFRCRCGDLFCADHRYSDRHDCSYDYKTAGREAIARENPVVRAAKILKV